VAPESVLQLHQLFEIALLLLDGALEDLKVHVRPNGVLQFVAQIVGRKRLAFPCFGVAGAFDKFVLAFARLLRGVEVLAQPKLVIVDLPVRHGDAVKFERLNAPKVAQ
jgi:hypothetical protein